MALLTFMRYRFAWWPLHPIGYTVASTNIIRNFVLSIFIGWSCKYLIVRFGGVMLYQKAKPFFLGLIVSLFYVSPLPLVMHSRLNSQCP